jgi:hypothetical protein
MLSLAVKDFRALGYSVVIRTGGLVYPNVLSRCLPPLYLEHPALMFDIQMDGFNLILHVAKFTFV